jgi:hypothetical protein
MCCTSEDNSQSALLERLLGTFMISRDNAPRKESVMKTTALLAMTIAFLVAAISANAGFTDNPRSHYCGTTRVAWKEGCQPTVACPPGKHGRFGGDRAFDIKYCH